MPRSLLEILLEKKDPKKSLTYPTREQFNAELKNLDEICTRTLIETFGTEGFGGVNTFEEIRVKLKEQQSILRKYKEEYQDYPWEDPTVQARLLDIKKIIMGDDPEKTGGLLLDLQEARIESLGEEDSYRIANTYFETAESLRVTGTQRILKIASMRDKEIKVDRARANTDLTENNEINSKKYDITAKKISENRPKDITDEDWKKRQEEVEKDNKKRKEEAARLRMGIFYYLGMIVGETQKDIKEKWGGGEDGETDPTDVQRGYRKELLVKAMPFIEKVTQQDFDEKDPLADKKYMNFVMILASYSPGYKNYKPDPKDQVVDNKITDEQKAVIGEAMGKRKDDIKSLIDAIKGRNAGAGIQKIIREEMEKAQAELDSVDAKTACDINSQRKLAKAKEELDKKVNDNKKILDPKDIEDLGKVADIIDEIFNYCANKSYIKEDKK
jgi:hypothetical protein